MAASLSAYWVKFFKGAGFPSDVATKHAVVFSNNRIKPDMLPDLDKPSLKEMGITLMGDMIAILRYAKKVVEDTTCERFLVDTEDERGNIAGGSPRIGRVVVKKAVAKASNKSTLSSLKSKNVRDTLPKTTPKTATSNGVSASGVTLKKKIVQGEGIAATIKNSSASKAPSVGTKRKLALTAGRRESDGEETRETIKDATRVPSDDIAQDDDESDIDSVSWTSKNAQKRLKLANEEDKVGYTVIMPKGRTSRSQEILKKLTEQKRTVFDRLGDSSVTSTTNPAETNTPPTFSVTGLGNDVLKRTSSSSVFNRLGDPAKAKNEISSRATTAGILRNGTNKNSSKSITAGILKTSRPSSIGSTTSAKISLSKVPMSGNAFAKSSGTMHADHEKKQRTASSSVKQLVRTTKKIRLNDLPTAKMAVKIVRKIDNHTSKLASERIGTVSAKARLGLGSGTTIAKQVTFDRVTRVARIKKPGVFSRLGV